MAKEKRTSGTPLSWFASVTSAGPPSWGMVQGAAAAAPTPRSFLSPSTHNFRGMEAEFAAGEVYGLRSWRVDSKGRLRARNIDNVAPWTPGVNLADCSQIATVRALDPSGSERQLVGMFYAPGFDGFYATWSDGATEKIEFLTSRPGDLSLHAPPNDECGCGFYAYFTPEHWENPEHIRLVHGVIKGYGRTLLGSKGFRSEKAEIAALLIPPGLDRRAKEITSAYPDVPILPTLEALKEFAPFTDQYDIAEGEKE